MYGKKKKVRTGTRAAAALVLAAAFVVLLALHSHTPSFVAGTLSGAAYFNGSTYVMLNNTVNGNFTAAVWVKYESDNPIGVILSSGVGENEHSAWYIGSGGEVVGKTACGVFSNQKVGNYTAGWRFASANELAPGAWHQVVCVYNTSSVSLYIDGSFVASEPSPYPLVHANIMEIGKRTSTFYLNGTVQTFAYFNGSIANVQVYSSALGPAGISELYKEGMSAQPFSNVSIYVPLNQGLHAGGSVKYYYHGRAMLASVV